MFDAEKLLGKVLSTAIGSGGYSRGKRRKNRQSDDLLGTLLGGLTSGKGLMTAIGLGVGAYEILANQSAGSACSPPPPVRPGAPVGTTPASSPPPVPPAVPAAQASPPPPRPSVEEPATRPETISSRELAIRLIQTMVAAAHADGRLDETEETRILEKIRDQGLSREEQSFLLDQLHNPLPIRELTAGINSPQLAQTMYSLAVSTIVIDTERERQWLDALADSLSISPSMQRFIEGEL